MIAYRTRPLILVTATLVSGLLVALTPGAVRGDNAEMPKKGTTPYVTHFVFRPLMTIDIPGLGTATPLEAVGTTQNLNGEPRVVLPESAAEAKPVFPVPDASVTLAPAASSKP